MAGTLPQPIALTIAGSDSSGGAGIQADLKTFTALGVYGASVITALTAQNTHGVTAIHAIPGDMITAQLRAVATDLKINAVKTGMLGDRATVEVVTAGLRDVPPCAARGRPGHGGDQRRRAARARCGLCRAPRADPARRSHHAQSA